MSIKHGPFLLQYFISMYSITHVTPYNRNKILNVMQSVDPLATWKHSARFSNGLFAHRSLFCWNSIVFWIRTWIGPLKKKWKKESVNNIEPCFQTYTACSVDENVDTRVGHCQTVEYEPNYNDLVVIQLRE